MHAECRRCWWTAALSWHWDNWQRNACTELFYDGSLFLCWLCVLTWNRLVCWYLHELQIYCDYSHVICSVSLLLSDSRDGCCQLFLLFCFKGANCLLCVSSPHFAPLSVDGSVIEANHPQPLLGSRLHELPAKHFIRIQQGAIDSHTQTHLRAFGQPGSWK